MSYTRENRQGCEKTNQTIADGRTTPHTHHTTPFIVSSWAVERQSADCTSARVNSHSLSSPATKQTCVCVLCDFVYAMQMPGFVAHAQASHSASALKSKTARAPAAEAVCLPGSWERSKNAVPLCSVYPGNNCALC